MRILLLRILALLPVFLLPVAAGAADLTEMSLESLMDMTVVGASRYEQKSIEAPTHACVVTAEDIRQVRVQEPGGRAPVASRGIHDERPELCVPRDPGIPARRGLQHENAASRGRPPDQQRHLRPRHGRGGVPRRHRPDRARGGGARAQLLPVRVERLLRRHQRHHEAGLRYRWSGAVRQRRKLGDVQGEGDGRQGFPHAGERRSLSPARRPGAAVRTSTSRNSTTPRPTTA